MRLLRQRVLQRRSSIRSANSRRRVLDQLGSDDDLERLRVPLIGSVARAFFPGTGKKALANRLHRGRP